MGIDEGNLQVIDVDVILENCPITIVLLNLLVYNSCLKKNLNAPRPSEHPPVRGKKCQNV